MGRSQLARSLHLPVVFDDGDHVAASQRGYMKNHQSQRAAADNGHRVAGMRVRVFKAMHRACQRLSERRVLQRHVVWDVKGILGHDASRNANELGVGAVVEEQIVAEVLLAASAEIALTAGGGIERDYAVAGNKARDSLAGLDNGSRQLMAKEGRRHDHARMVAAAEDLQVSAAGERRADADDQLTGPGLGNRHALYANILASVEDRGLHRCAAVEKHVLDGHAALVDGGFDLLAAFDDHRLDCIQAYPNDRLDCIQAPLDNVLDLFAAFFDNSLDGLTASEDHVLYCVRHRTPPI